MHGFDSTDRKTDARIDNVQRGRISVAVAQLDEEVVRLAACILRMPPKYRIVLDVQRTGLKSTRTRFGAHAICFGGCGRLRWDEAWRGGGERRRELELRGGDVCAGWGEGGEDAYVEPPADEFEALEQREAELRELVVAHLQLSSKVLRRHRLAQD